MTPLARLTTILARTPGVPDSTPLTMGGEVELELTMGDLSWLADIASRCGGDNCFGKQVNGLQSWVRKDRLETAEANLARAREIMKPFAAVADLMAPLVKSNPERWPDDKPNSEFIPGNWPRWSDFRAVSRFLTEGEGT